MKRSFVLCVVFVTSISAYAGDRSDFESVLVPISGVDNSRGAFGSVWKTEFTIVAQDGEVDLEQTFFCGACIPEIRISPGFPFDGQFGGVPGDPPGALIYPSRATVDYAWFNLRIRDVSRESDDFGTELPVVREREFFNTQLLLVDVPIDARFREALRIYDVDARAGTIFHVTVMGLNSKTIAERDFTVHSGTPSVPSFPGIPSVVEITDMRVAFPEITAASRVAVRLRR